MLFFTAHHECPGLFWRTTVQQLVTGILLAFELCHELSPQRVTTYMRESVWMRACVCVRLPPAHTLPLLLFCSRQTVALVTQRAPVCWKCEKNAALFIYLSNFFSSFLSKGREYAPRIFSHQEGETEMTSDVTRLEHYWFFFSLCILQIQQLNLLFTSFPPKPHCGRLYEKTNKRSTKPNIYIKQHHLDINKQISLS